MKRPKLLSEEILIYLEDEWDTPEEFKTWLTTRALQMKLKARGIITTWPTLSIRLNDLLLLEKVTKIKTSAGYCWKPSN